MEEPDLLLVLAQLSWVAGLTVIDELSVAVLHATETFSDASTEEASGEDPKIVAVVSVVSDISVVGAREEERVEAVGISGGRVSLEIPFLAEK